MNLFVAHSTLNNHQSHFKFLDIMNSRDLDISALAFWCIHAPISFGYKPVRGTASSKAMYMFSFNKTVLQCNFTNVDISFPNCLNTRLLITFVHKIYVQLKCISNTRSYLLACIFFSPNGMFGLKDVFNFNVVKLINHFLYGQCSVFFFFKSLPIIRSWKQFSLVLTFHKCFLILTFHIQSYQLLLKNIKNKPVV